MNASKSAASRLAELRELILETARETDGVGEIEEALRWGQQSFLTSQTGSGSTVRIDADRKDPNRVAVFFHCQSGLVPEFRRIYGDSLNFEGDRAILLDANRPLPRKILKHCVALALTHHLRKKKTQKRARRL